MVLYVFAATLAATALAADTSNLKYFSYPFQFSNLSPLVTYYPADAWTHNVWGSNTTSSDARVEFEALGWDLIVNGYRTGDASWRADPEYQLDNAPPPLFERGSRQGLLVVRTLNGNERLRNVSITNGEGEMSVAQLHQSTVLPGVSERQVDITRQPGILNGSINPFFTGDWTVEDAVPGTQTSRVQSFNLGPSQGNNSNIPSIWYADRFDPAFPSNSTLSSLNATLSFVIPPGTSFLQWYGAVGPDYGPFELALDSVGSEYPFTKTNYTASAERPVASGRELIMVAYLDPRVAYTGEIRSLGKRVDVDGIFFTSYLDDPSRLVATSENGAGRAGLSVLIALTALAILLI